MTYKEAKTLRKGSKVYYKTKTDKGVVIFSNKWITSIFWERLKSAENPEGIGEMDTDNLIDIHRL